MADLAALATGNFLTAGTWGVADTTSKLVSTSASVTALTTGNLDSTAFTPGAITVIGVMVRLGARASGSPTNTMTITLRNSTAGADVTSVTVNVSDLPACSTGDVDGGWHFLKFSASQLLLAATNYVIRATLSSTSTAVSLCTNGTANNWQRLLITDTTQAPVAGDDTFVGQIYDGAASPATLTSVAVTQDETAPTDYGSANTDARVPALSVSSGGTVAAPTNASSLLRLSGFAVVYAGGLLTLGTEASPVETAYNAILEFDCASGFLPGLTIRRGGTVEFCGAPRTAGKEVFWTLLSADHAAADTTLNVTDDTGWKSGDDIFIASSTRTASQREYRVLNGNAGATSMAITVGLTNAHGLTSDAALQTEVALLTRNVIMRSVSATYHSSLDIGNGASCTARWTWFQYLSNGGGIVLRTVTGTSYFQYCSIGSSQVNGVAVQTLLAVAFTFDKCFFYALGTNLGQSGPDFTSTSLTAAWSITDCVFAHLGQQASSSGVSICPGYGTFTGNRITSNNGSGLGISSPLVVPLQAEISDVVVHSCGNTGINYYGQSSAPFTLSNLTSCLNAGSGFNFGNFNNGQAMLGNLTVENLIALGNTTYNLALVGVLQRYCRCTFKNSVFASVSGYTTTSGAYWSTGGIMDWLFDDCTFGVASGVRTAHTYDFNFQFFTTYTMRLRNCTMASATEIFNAASLAYGSCISSQRHDGVAGAHKVWTYNGGLVEIETGTVDVSPGVKMTPATTVAKLDTGAAQLGRGFLIRVLDTEQPTVSVNVRKNAAYNGAAPRLILKGNSALGIGADDVVLDTLSVAADTWETLSAQIPSAVTDDGAIEVVVDCDGTAGSVFVDTLAVS